MHILLFLAAALHAQCAEDRGPSDRLIAALIQVESVGKDDAVGDLNLENHAYGPLQIRQPVCDDVNEHFGTSFRADQCLGNRSLSIQIFRRYVSLHATRRSLGHAPRDEDYARIWNGGPSGWHRECTKKYWEKVLSVGRPEHRPKIRRAHRGRSRHRSIRGTRR
ncbi:MAG: hypothetical protein KGI45_01245 [Patescibacteria group bacterium]|nr:hypothetical protein [Patescibacteria group bacterium]MDE1940998.1 hypothetical protein [Patescibacteria group bacterium]MDE1966683.1 hypothetical protein [Patescibacteria group bacterium]